MKFELYNNSKKLIMGVSILFCTVILIIGGTIAFFTQSDSEDTGDIATTNINGTLLFDDNNEYMFGNFIPVEENHVLSFASKTTDKCKYQDDMYACNLYEFTVTNNSDVTQELIFTLDVKENGFGNLYYNLLESSINEITTDSKYVKSKVHIEGTGKKEMLNNIVLGPKEYKTYTIIYYVKNFNDKDQTSMDANKKFYANIRVDSITTGTYTGTLMPAESCYTYELITEEDSEVYGELIDEVIGTYRLTSFKGIPNEGEIKTECGVTENNDLYSVTIPSKLKDENGNELEVGALGNSLFYAFDTTNYSLNKYSKINNIEIEEGIKVIDNSLLVSGMPIGTFSGVGVDSVDLSTFAILSEHDVNIVLPTTLESIGKYAFPFTGTKTISFNNNTNNDISLNTIGDYAFGIGKIKNIEIPSNIKYIGEGSFRAAIIDNLTISSDFTLPNGQSYDYNTSPFVEATINNLVINEGVTTIGDYLFYESNIVNDENNPLVIPSTVTYIGKDAFWNNYNLTKLEFAGSPTLITEENQLTIGDFAFYGDGLDYAGEEELVLPARIKSIGNAAFNGNPGDPILASLKNIRYMGSRDILNTFSGSWYPSGATVKAYGE